MSAADFVTRKARGDFALDWQAHGLGYGIPKDQLTDPGDVFSNGSRAALPQATQLFPNLRVILITAPDAILATRGRETDADIRDRLTLAAFALPAGITAETVLTDGPPEPGIARLLAAIQPVRA